MEQVPWRARVRGPQRVRVNSCSPRFADFESHDGPRRRAASDFFESRLTESSFESRPRKDVRDATRFGRDGITFNDLCAALSRELDRAAQKFLCYTSATISFRDIETDNRPNRLFVNFCERARGLQFQIGLARRDRAPAHWLSARISNQSGCGSRSHNLLKRIFVFQSLLLFEIGVRKLPVHAPATGTRAAGTEQLLEIGPPRRSDRVDLNGLCPRVSGFICGSHAHPQPRR